MKSESVKVEIPVTTVTIDWNTIITLTSAERVQVAGLIRRLEEVDLNTNERQLANALFDALGVAPLRRPSKVCAFGRCAKAAVANSNCCQEHANR